MRQQIRWETIRHIESTTGERINDWEKLETLKAPFVKKVEDEFKKRNDARTASKGQGKGKPEAMKAKPIPKKLTAVPKAKPGKKKR